MNKDKSDKSINASDLPQSETFKKEEVYQQKQPADTGKALKNIADEKENKETANGVAETDKTSKEDGLNQHNSKGNAGAFEGFEDQQHDV